MLPVDSVNQVCCIVRERAKVLGCLWNDIHPGKWAIFNIIDTYLGDGGETLRNLKANQSPNNIQPLIYSCSHSSFKFIGNNDLLSDEVY